MPNSSAANAETPPAAPTPAEVSAAHRRGERKGGGGDLAGAFEEDEKRDDVRRVVHECNVVSARLAGVHVVPARRVGIPEVHTSVKR